MILHVGPPDQRSDHIGREPLGRDGAPPQAFSRCRDIGRSGQRLLLCRAMEKDCRPERYRAKYLPGSRDVCNKPRPATHRLSAKICAVLFLLLSAQGGHVTAQDMAWERLGSELNHATVALARKDAQAISSQVETLGQIIGSLDQANCAAPQSKLQRLAARRLLDDFASAARLGNWEKAGWTLRRLKQKVRLLAPSEQKKC